MLCADIIKSYAFPYGSFAGCSLRAGWLLVPFLQDNHIARIIIIKYKEKKIGARQSGWDKKYNGEKVKHLKYSS